jgi:hypothetical protein
VTEEIRFACAAAFRKSTTYVNESSFYLVEYFDRMRFKELGYTTDYNQIDCLKAEAFRLISCEMDKLSEAKRERDSKRR